MFACKPVTPLSAPSHPAELGTGDLPIRMVDESVAAAWENSAPAREELAASSPAPIVRRAVGLGRQLLDPLALLASLCGRSREVLSLQLHPLQAQVRFSRAVPACCATRLHCGAAGTAPALGIYSTQHRLPL